MSAVLRRQHLVRHLHRLGERAVDEFLAELGSGHGIEDSILVNLEAYGRLDPTILRALGAANLADREFLVIDGEAA